MLKGTFTSVWEEGEIETPATLNEETGEVEATFSDDGSEYEHLIREKFTDLEDNEYEVCTTCHSHIMKTVMVDDNVGACIHEELVCSGGCKE